MRLISAISLVALLVMVTGTGISVVRVQMPPRYLGPTFTVVKSIAAGPDDLAVGRVECPNGSVALGGGWYSWSPPDWEILASSPTVDGVAPRDGAGTFGPANGWSLFARSGSEHARWIAVSVVCARVIRS